jgi:hypothetical protein
MTDRHYIASGPYDVPQNAPHYMRNSVQLVEVGNGLFRQLGTGAGISPAAAVLNDLVATMQAIKNLYDKPGELTDTQDRQLSMLDNRRFALEDQLQQMVKDTLGVDYAVLWHAVTPSGPIPKLP